MAKRQVTTWTCDRCGASVTVDKKVPDGWRRLEILRGHRALIQADLCPSCTEQAEKFVGQKIVSE